MKDFMVTFFVRTGSSGFESASIPVSARSFDDAYKIVEGMFPHFDVEDNLTISPVQRFVKRKGLVPVDPIHKI